MCNSQYVRRLWTWNTNTTTNDDDDNNLQKPNYFTQLSCVNTIPRQLQMWQHPFNILRDKPGSLHHTKLKHLRANYLIKIIRLRENC